MKFFLPIGRDVAWERETYTLLKRLLSATLATSFTERQICSLHYQAEGQASDVDVGQPHPLNGEIIIAILEGTSPPRYYVCTRTRGSPTACPSSSTPRTCSPSPSLSRRNAPPASRESKRVTTALTGARNAAGSR
jgi:hypothetical protein